MRTRDARARARAGGAGEGAEARGGPEVTHGLAVSLS
jgi:hypothetical protein